MGLSENLVAVTTIVCCLVLVLALVSLGWWLVWKVFLSRFQFINEILFPPVTEEEKQKSVARRKIRRE